MLVGAVARDGHARDMGLSVGRVSIAEEKSWSTEGLLEECGIGCKANRCEVERN